MISVGNRDARKGLGFGVVVVGMREMEDCELEEGEACSYQNHEDYDANIDPDVALSYIDEKIQDVLGHFQKDFEGGVSAENLGAKFGGYGSFLPTYQRSPGWGHPRTPQKVHSQNTPGSPNKLQLEGGRGNTVPLSTGSQSLKFGPGSVSSSRLPDFKAPMVNDAIPREKCMTTGAEAFSSKYEPFNMNSTSIPDQKTLKVRIRVGLENLPTQKNVAIYSGLGLNESPSSSLDDSPSESEGLSREPQHAPLESPTSILQILTVVPALLSPLSGDLIQLNEKETCPRENISVPVHIDDSESSGMLRRGSNILKGDQNLSGGKKMKSLGDHESSMEAKTFTKTNTQNDGVLSRKGQGMDELATEELVSKTLKLPLLSSSYSDTDDSVKNVHGTCGTLKEANKNGMVREKTYSNHSQKGWMDPTSPEENGFVGRTKGSSGDLVQKVRVGPASTEVNGRIKGGLGKKVGDKGSVEDLSVYTAKDYHDRDKICDSVVVVPDVSKVRTTSSAERIGPHKKSKGSNGTMVTEREKGKLKVGTPLVPKSKKRSDSSTSKYGTEDVRVQKDPGKASDTYRDFFGDSEEDEDRIDSPETPYGDKLKETKVVKRNIPAINRGAKESSGGKIVDKSLTSDVYSKTTTNVKYTGNVHGADTYNGKGGTVSVPSVAVEDNWVQCDRCHKWRLLPVGTNPDNLPEKWLCSMLNWLPEMNRCSFSEDETTKAVIELHQGPPPEGQITLQQQLHHDLHAVPCAKKKIAKEISNSANKDDSSYLKKNLNSSVKSRSLNDVNVSPVMSDANALLEKHRSKQRMLEQNSARGNTNNMKVKSRKNPDEDCFRSYKKSKIDGMHSTDKEWILEQGWTTTNSSFPTTSVGKNQHRQKGRSSSKDSKYDQRDRLQVSVQITKNNGKGSLDEGSRDFGNHDSNGSIKKRKLKEYEDTQLQEGRVFVQEFGDSRKDKKVKHSKSEGKEPGSSKGSGRADKKGSHTKNQKLRQYPDNTLSQWSLGSVQASAAATTSSSSKVSGSHKTIANFQEVKSSPVESVSSSPMRILNTDKSTNRELMWKDGSHDTVMVGSPRRCSDDEDGNGSDRSKTVKKDKSVIMAHKKSRESSMLDSQNKGVNHDSNIKSKAQTAPSPDIVTSNFINHGVHTIDQDGTYPDTGKSIDQCNGEDRNGVYHANLTHPRKTGKGSHLKDNSESFKSGSNAERVRITGSHIQLPECPTSELKHRDGKVKSQKFGFKPDDSENIHIGKKGYSENEKGKKEDQLNRKHDIQEVGIDAMCKQEALPAPRQNQLLDCDTERSSKRSLSERTDQEVFGKGKLSLPPSGGDQVGTSGRFPQPFVGLHKGNENVEVDPPKIHDALKLQKKQTRKADHQNGIEQIGSKHPTLDGHISKELESPSPIRKDTNSRTTANSALKEAKDLKHLADRLQSSGSTLERTGIYFQAALKFLRGASLLESSNNDNTNEMVRSKEIYSSTANLCEFCAREFEKSKDMAAAALAYKCMEVAYMRVIYSSNTSASRDRHELQTALQMVPLGESPSSSASDVDNVNNSTTADKVALSKSTSSPQIVGTHLIAARNRPNIVRLLSYAKDMNFAMEASRKSRHAFAAANSSRGEGKHGEGISSIKQALDFSFQDVEGLLRLVRLAMETIAR
ncbi:hypothetical protein Lal_00000301 [Lupinus albus]|uniref:Putative transcription factor & chromatin remodeling CW-Zn family n=1 Tax=Lupinus albus TaxID=3870 RepID=A0A6A5LI54_LUPAL|nr:putative transcription factor & chromatin remodeling CW-Zn family [Lupinus albus]KAF1860887.1 hypothetical protein Lal_00000301 [Lupinus albus]